MVTLKGKKYEIRQIEPCDVRRGAFVRFANGVTSRRIVGEDGTDIILRGVLSANVLEAVDRDALLEQWELMVPVE